MFPKPKTESDPKVVSREWEQRKEMLRPDLNVLGTTFFGQQKDFPAFSDYFAIGLLWQGRGFSLY